MKKLTQLLLILLFILVPAYPALADTSDKDYVKPVEEEEEEYVTPVVTEDTETKTTTSVNKYFELELHFDSQNPLNKSLEYVLTIKPKIDSPRTQISWDLPTVLVARPRHKEFVSLREGQSYTYRVSIIPQKGGVYDVTANVTGWQNEVNLTNSVSTTVTLSKSLVTQPVDSSYQISLILIVVAVIGIIAGVAFLGYKFSSKGMEKLKVWLTPPF